MAYLARAIAVAPLLLLMMSSSASVRGQQPSITVVPSEGPCGGEVVVSGEGFPASTDVLVVGVPDIPVGLEGTPPATTTEADGSFEATITMPSFDVPCPSDEGMIVFACPQPNCEPKLRVPFTITSGAAELPGTGSGSSPAGSGLQYVLYGLVMGGGLLLVLGRWLRSSSGTQE